MNATDRTAVTAPIAGIAGHGAKLVRRLCNRLFPIEAEPPVPVIVNVPHRLTEDDWAFIEHMYKRVVFALEEMPGAVRGEGEVKPAIADVYSLQAQKVVLELNGLCRTYGRQISRLQGE